MSLMELFFKTIKVKGNPPKDTWYVECIGQSFNVLFNPGAIHYYFAPGMFFRKEDVEEIQTPGTFSGVFNQTEIYLN